MRNLIVYDSFFGNTEQVATAIGAAVGSEPDVAVCRVTEVDPQQLEGLAYLIVGSPTRAFSPSPAIKAFLKQIPPNQLRGVKVAAFDTRIAVEDTGSRILSFMVKLFGYAAKPMLRRLVKKGGDAAAPAEGFYVEGSEGPLKEGELKRATDWAKRMVGTS